MGQSEGQRHRSQHRVIGSAHAAFVLHERLPQPRGRTRPTIAWKPLAEAVENRTMSVLAAEGDRFEEIRRSYFRQRVSSCLVTEAGVADVVSDQHRLDPAGI